MMTCFPIMLSVTCHIGNINVSAVLEQVVISFQRIRQRASNCLTLSCKMAADCAPGALAMTTSGGAAIGW